MDLVGWVHGDVLHFETMRGTAQPHGSLHRKMQPCEGTVSECVPAPSTTKRKINKELNKPTRPELSDEVSFKNIHCLCKDHHRFMLHIKIRVGKTPSLQSDYPVCHRYESLCKLE
jgi:hypothetical protein